MTSVSTRDGSVAPETLASSPLPVTVHFIPPSQRRLALLAAQADTAPVLICGGSGTGKGEMARWIHEYGPRAGQPWVVATHKQSLARQIPTAQGGTLLINDIGSWPLGEQRVLLNFLQTKALDLEVRTLFNVRIMTTTSQLLEGRAQTGLFSRELLEKLNVFRLEMPNLSERGEEFEDIALGILAEVARDAKREFLRELSPEALGILRAYDWPGNLRELRNVLKLAVASAQGARIEAKDLPEFGHDRVDFRATREQFEKIYLVELLKMFDGKIEKTCQMSLIDKETLLSKIRKYRIEEVLQLSP